MEERIGFWDQKLEPQLRASRAERLKYNREMLSRVLNLRTTVAFVGAGCSAPLGYPTWKGFAERAVEHTILTLNAMPRTAELQAELNHLNRFEEQVSGGNSRLPFILGKCKSILYNRGAESSYLEFLKQTFQPQTPPQGAPNPYHTLLKLPIRRFITSNYDGEIERSLVKERNTPPGEFVLRDNSTGRTRSFTQKPEYYDQLALFSLARVREAENLVFHCHGHYEDPDSMVVTEDDYQRWYFRQDPGADAFRQTMELLFTSNPILFVGFGLGEDDLLRPLRILTASTPDRDIVRPLFALMAEEADGKEEDYHEFLYERYGVNVIPFVSPNAQERGRDLCEAITRLRRDWNEWWGKLLEKPMMRRVEVNARPPEPYHHYPRAPNRGPVFGGSRFQELLSNLRREVEAGARAIAIIGAGGTGKSWCAQRLVEYLHDENVGFEGVFFWSSYYANDWLTGLDRALSYLEPEPELSGSRLERFAQCIRNGRYLLVFDGIERLMRETENPGEGCGLSPGAVEFLNLLADRDSKSTIIITSRLWPQEFGSPQPQPHEKIKRFSVVRFTTGDIKDVEPFSWIRERHEISALCSLLDGHVYCLALAADLLRQARERDAQSRLKDICRELSHAPPDRRTQRMIRLAIESLDEKWHGLALKLLERVAIFMSPVDRRTIDICFESAIAGMPEVSSELRDDLVRALVSSNLLHEVINKRQRPKMVAYTMHPIVRGYIFQRVHGAATDALPDFTLPGFTAGTAIIDPGGKEGVEVVGDIFKRLHDAAYQAGKQEKQAEAVALCRSAFGVVRSRMVSNAAPRWCVYNDYIRVVTRLARLAKNVSPRTWSYAERHEIRAVEDWYGPLYADELAWVYNEIGLASYGEGIMLNALAAWEQGYEINKVIDSYEEGGNYLFQSQCNLGAAYIHFGRLNVAYRYLRDAEQTNYRLKDLDHAGRIKGYMALVQHLRGNLNEADSLYDQTQEKLEQAGGNPRAESVFLRHQADLKISLGQSDQARHLLQSSQSLAEAGQYPDLVAYARASLGHWYRNQKDYKRALHEYNAALNTARQIGIRRLESEVLSELSRLAIDLGDAQIARQRAIEALRIANEVVLGLRQTHGLVVLGKASIQAGLRSLGIAYLKHAKALADRQEYWLRGGEAEEALQELGESTSDQPVSNRLGRK